MITDIHSLDPNGIYTYADYLKWQFEEQVELIKDKLYRMSSAPKMGHQWVSGQLSFLFNKYFEEKPLPRKRPIPIRGNLGQISRPIGYF